MIHKHSVFGRWARADVQCTCEKPEQETILCGESMKFFLLRALLFTRARLSVWFGEQKGGGGRRESEEGIRSCQLYVYVCSYAMVVVWRDWGDGVVC